MSDKQRVRAEFQPLESLIVDLHTPCELWTNVIDVVSALKVGISPAVFRGEPGKSPRIGEDGCWLVYDDEKGEWITTNVPARGEWAIPEILTIDGGTASGDM